MRVDLFINGNAGYADQAEIESRVKRVLFRCELHFHAPKSIPEMRDQIAAVTEAGSECLIISGGDGTLNACLAPLMKRYHAGLFVPPICLVPVGTANDLAFSLGTPRRIERAARAVLEGRIQTVNILEITSEGRVAHMVTNGGLGIPAETAENANRFRSWVKREAKKESRRSQRLFQWGEKLISAAGPKIYEILLVRNIALWEMDRGETERWEVTLEMTGQPAFRTQAPFIMVNNQPSLAGGYMTAPLTTHSDGSFNVLLIDSRRLASQLKALLAIRRGRTPDAAVCPTYETRSLKLSVSDRSRPLTFFGDGEILHQGVRELEIECLHPGIPFIRME